MKKFILLVALFVGFGISLNAQDTVKKCDKSKKECAKKCSKKKVASAGMTVDIEAAKLAAAKNDNIETRTCAKSGKVSFVETYKCPKSGKDMTREVQYDADSKAFKPAKSCCKKGKKTSCKKGGKKVCDKGAKKACSKKGADKKSCSKKCKKACAKGKVANADKKCAKKSCCKKKAKVASRGKRNSAVGKAGARA